MAKIGSSSSTDLFDDKTPQLGGALDRNGHVILGQITGVEWNQTTDVWTRIDKYGGTITLTRAAFDDFFPWAGMRRVNLSVAGEINAVYGDDSFSETGSNGRVMVQIPRFWVKSDKIIEGAETKYRWWIADHEAAGFEVHPAFRQRVGGTVAAPTGSIAQFIYLGAYEATLMDDAGTVKFDSKSAEQPFTGAAIAKIDFITGLNEPVVGDTISCADSGDTAVLVAYHKAAGTWGVDASGSLYLKHPGDATLSWETAKILTNDTQASEALATSDSASAEEALDIDDARGYGEAVGTGWGIMNIWSLSAIKMLFMIEYGDMDSQTQIEKGIVDKASGTGFAGEETATDSINSSLASNGSGAGTGTDGLTPIAYRWIENLWGNVWQYIDGCEVVDAAHHILNRNGAWDNSGPSAWDADDYEASVATPTTNNGYISNIEYEALLKYILISSVVAGSDSTYLPDYSYGHDAAETNTSLAGGFWADGLYNGLNSLRSDLDATYSARIVGARLEFIG